METKSKVQGTNKKSTTAKSVSETGHAKNIANLQNLISFCQGYGATYNPSKQSLTITELQDLYQNAFAKLNLTKTYKTAFDNATNDRRHEFENLKALSTKILNAFIVSGADNLAIADLKSINNKIQGTRKRKKSDTTEKETKETTSTEVLETIRTISTSQQSYDRLIDHFANLIQVLEQNSFYNPNENELKITTLQTKKEKLQTTNSSLINAYTTYSNSLIQRNQVLYDHFIGLVQTAKEVKQYVKSVYGATSPEYNQVSSLEFKIIKI